MNDDPSYTRGYGKMADRLSMQSYILQMTSEKMQIFA